jgi:hypothetical protein
MNLSLLFPILVVYLLGVAITMLIRENADLTDIEYISNIVFWPFYLIKIVIKLIIFTVCNLLGINN